MNDKYEIDISKKPINPTAMAEDVARALEEILIEKPKNHLIQTAIPRMLKNIKEYSLNYHCEILDGHSLYFEIKRTALKLIRTGNTSYENMLDSLIDEIFNGGNPELGSLHQVFSKYKLTDIVQGAIADHVHKK